MSVTRLLPFVSAAVIFVFALLVFQRYARRKGTHLLIWGIGLVMYGIGSLTESYYSVFGWHDLGFRLWYLCGAILVAAWLGQGTVYLLVRRRIANIKLAHILFVLLLLGSLYGAYKVFTAQLDPSLMPGASLSGHAITTPGVRILTPFFNIYGLVALVGGAIYSAWIFWRKRIMPHRVIGNILIAVGALAPSISGALSRVGLTEWLYLGELLGAILMFIGFIQATQRVPEARPAPAEAAPTS
ncbi:MAG: hypothetical protein ACE5MB_02520 [Anaerolineae bacterium]